MLPTLVQSLSKRREQQGSLQEDSKAVNLYKWEAVVLGSHPSA
jgi:hypothetical protein